MGIGAELATWQAFFSAVAGVSGTLVGLLFVALGINPIVMASASPAGIRVQAELTFHSFIVLLLLGLIGLVPDDQGKTMMITLVIIGVQGIGRVLYDVWAERSDPDPKWHGMQSARRKLYPTIAYLISLWLAYAIWQGDDSWFGLFVAIVFLLTLSASISSWELLKFIGEQNRG